MSTTDPARSAAEPSAFDLVEVAIPATVEAQDAELFLRTMDVRNTLYRHLYGSDDMLDAPATVLPSWQDPYEDGSLWLVRADGRDAGRVGLQLPLEEGSVSAYLFIELLPEFWNRGIGTAIEERMAALTRERGRTELKSWAYHPRAEGEQLVPPTGFGSVPAVDHAAVFFLAQGYALGQVERISRFEHAGREEAVERQRAAAQEKAGDDYRFIAWDGPTPEEYIEQMAVMRSRMSVDVPAGEMDYDEEKWDAARTRSYDERNARRGRLIQTGAILHGPSGEIVAYNELVSGFRPELSSHQEDTFVLSSHRGHRLGMLVKTNGILRWRTVNPESPAITTYNAEENRPMLSVNEELGFEPIGYEGAWKKVLGSAG